MYFAFSALSRTPKHLAPNCSLTLVTIFSWISLMVLKDFPLDFSITSSELLHWNESSLIWSCLALLYLRVEVVPTTWFWVFFGVSSAVVAAVFFSVSGFLLGLSFCLTSLFLNVRSFGLFSDSLCSSEAFDFDSVKVLFYEFFLGFSVGDGGVFLVLMQLEAAFSALDFCSQSDDCLAGLDSF